MDEHRYPVSYDIERPQQYNRWTVAFRLILAIPQLILVGSGSLPFILFGGSGGGDDNLRNSSGGLSSGILMAVLGFLVFLAWFSIMFTGRFPKSFRDFCHMLFRWSRNVHAYMMLQAAPYPPFGKGDYPLVMTVQQAEHYNRWTVFFRIFLAIPHLVVLMFLGIGQAIVTIIAWFAILFTGQFPASLFEFSVGVSRWETRVMAYLYLFVDEYPPFTLTDAPVAGAGQHAYAS